MAHVGQKITLGTIGRLGLFLGVKQFEFCAFGMGDIPIGPDHARPTSVRSPVRGSSPHKNPAPATGFAGNPELGLEIVQLTTKMGAELVTRQSQVIRMNQRQPGREIGRPLGGIISKHLSPVVVHDDFTMGKIPVPQPAFRVLHRQIEALTRIADVALGPFATGEQAFKQAKDVGRRSTREIERHPQPTVGNTRSKECSKRPSDFSIGRIRIGIRTNHVGDQFGDIEVRKARQTSQHA